MVDVGMTSLSASPASVSIGTDNTGMGKRQSDSYRVVQKGQTRTRPVGDVSVHCRVFDRAGSRE